MGFLVTPTGAVDLGLVITRTDGTTYKLYWAKSNLGENGLCANPEDYGDYYAWGETEPYYSSQIPLNWKDGKSGYNWSTYTLCGGSESTMTKYCTSSSYGTVDNKTVLDPEDDVAHVKLGGKWRIPTDAEWIELRNTDNCDWAWTTVNGVNERLVTSKKTGNSIFLPAAGHRYGDNLYNAGSDGSFWSSSLNTGYPYKAWGVYFGSDVGRVNSNCCYGRSVRPVCD